MSTALQSHIHGGWVPAESVLFSFCSVLKFLLFVLYCSQNSTADAAVDARFEAMLAQRRAAAATELAAAKVTEAVRYRRRSCVHSTLVVVTTVLLVTVPVEPFSRCKTHVQAGVFGERINAAGSAVGMDLAGTAGAIADTAGAVGVRLRFSKTSPEHLCTHFIFR